MRRLRGWIIRLAGLFNKRRKDRDLDEELESHLQMHIDDNVRLGMTPEEARRVAMIELGSVESTKEACRDQRGFPLVETALQDMRYAARMLRKNPGFAAVAVLTLALGIGANTVLFSVAKAVLFRPLDLHTPERLMWVQLKNVQTGTTEHRLSWREMEDIRESTQAFESLATFGSGGAVWEQDGRVEVLPELRVTPNLADVLRIRPAVGRMLLPSDAQETAAPVVMIGYELWQGRFGGRPEIMGQSLRLNEKSHTVVGVLPKGLQFPLGKFVSAGNGSGVNSGSQSFWFPMAVQESDRNSRDARMFLPIGRLKPDATEEAARAELAAIGQRLATEYPETNRNWRFEVVSLRDQILGRTRHAIPLLALSVVAVLLICCVNLANLLLARGMRRERELAVRLALGAGRARLVQALLLESILLSLIGGALGIGLAKGALDVIRTLASTTVPFISEAAIDGVVLFFTTGLSLVTALAFGALPALWQTRIHSTAALHSGTRTTAGPQLKAWQQSLLVGQIAIVVVLLASAGLLLESFRRLMSEDLGYEPEAVLAVDLNSWGMPTNADLCRLYRTLYARLSALPGVQSVGTVSSAPLTGKWPFDEKAQVLGRPVPEADRPVLAATFVAFDYFQAMGIPLLDGRFFRNTELNDEGYGQIVIVNEAAASLLFPGRSAVGGRFTVGSNPDRVLEVVGVVKDTRDVRLEEKPQPRFYWQYAFGGAQIVIRSAIPSRALTPLVHDIISQTDSRFIIEGITPMTQIVSGTVAERRFLMSMLAIYAAAALSVAAVGIFGVLSYQVTQRTNEFGVRLALGETPSGLMRHVLKQAGRFGIVGLFIGLVFSLVATRVLANQLYGISPHNPYVLGVVSLLLFGVVLAAGLIPARRAAKVDPMVALRYE